MENFTQLKDSFYQISVQIVSKLPYLIAWIIGMFVFLKILRFLSDKISKIWLKRIKKNRKIKNFAELEKRSNTLFSVIYSSIKILVISFTFLQILKMFGIDIAPLLAGAGIAGLAIGFGSQELVRDFIAGIFMLLENQIRTGDIAIINGTSGTVESIGLRTTILRDISGVIHIFQNGKINSLSNMTKEWSGIIFKISVAYKEDLEKVTNVMISVAKELFEDPKYKDIILSNFELFGVDEFADSGIIIKARFKTIPMKQWEVGREYRRRLKTAFDKNDIEIPFPHRTIYWGNNNNNNEIEN